MMLRWQPRLLIIILSLQSGLLLANTANNTSSLFISLLNESGLSFALPEKFEQIALESNTVFPYEYAIQHTSKPLEIRFLIRPLGRLSIDYQDPHNAEPEPNHLFPLLFESITNQLSLGSNSVTTEYSQPQAKKLFNADWAAACLLDLNPDFSKKFKLGLVIGIHKDNQADAYSVILFNQYVDMKAIIDHAVSALVFKNAKQ